MHACSRALVAIAIISLSACSRPEPGPEVIVRDFYTNVGDCCRAQGSVGKELFSRLSSSTRQALEKAAERTNAAVAAATSEATDEIQPYELLASRGFIHGDRVDLESVETISLTDTSAVVAVKLTWLSAQAKAPRAEPETIKVDVVREDGMWRLVLPIHE